MKAKYCCIIIIHATTTLLNIVRGRARQHCIEASYVLIAYSEVVIYTLRDFDPLANVDAAYKGILLDNAMCAHFEHVM